MEVLTVDAEGHVAIPKSIRDRMDLKPGDKLVVYNRGDLLVCKKVEGEASILRTLAQPTREKIKQVGISREDVQDAILWSRGVL